MKLAEFDYILPEELIAQEPSPVRDLSRMMVVDRQRGSVAMHTFRDLPGYFGRGDLLVVNDSRVFPARLVGRKETGGMIELLLLKRSPEAPEGETWEVLLRPAKRVAIGTEIDIAGNCRAAVVGRLTEKRWLIRFAAEQAFDDFLNRHGRAPLPPYIKRRRDRPRSAEDLERYQTVYARVNGSVAAPTAGLHFTPEVLEGLRQRGAEVAPVTLHIGYGTFLPVETQCVEDHVMEEEHFSVSEETCRQINAANRVIAVGTTATRVLETLADSSGRVAPASGSTGLYLYPGYRFRRVDALLTNFHLPKSSLFLLVCAFAGRELMMRAYELAVANRFRFYSYGDCMLIL